jgi:hypothetical protein
MKSHEWDEPLDFYRGTELLTDLHHDRIKDNLKRVEMHF